MAETRPEIPLCHIETRDSACMQAQLHIPMRRLESPRLTSHSTAHLAGPRRSVHPKHALGVSMGRRVGVTVSSLYQGPGEHAMGTFDVCMVADPQGKEG